MYQVIHVGGALPTACYGSLRWFPWSTKSEAANSRYLPLNSYTQHQSLTWGSSKSHVEDRTAGRCLVSCDTVLCNKHHNVRFSQPAQQDHHEIQAQCGNLLGMTMLAKHSVGTYRGWLCWPSIVWELIRDDHAVHYGVGSYRGWLFWPSTA